MDEEMAKPRIGTARKLARSIIEKIGIVQAPISLLAVIILRKKDHNLDVYLTTAFSDRLSGMLVTVESDSFDDRRDEIHINQNHPWVKKRFSIAHEIGHMLMNTSCSNLEASLNDNASAETEANAFAAELLMPLAILKRDINKVHNIDTLAWNYIVAKEAMGWKIAGSGLLNKI